MNFNLLMQTSSSLKHVFLTLYLLKDSHGTALPKFCLLKLKSSKTTYPTSNEKSLACDTANEHALTCTREACRQLSNGTNGDDLSIHTYSNGREHYSDS